MSYQPPPASQARQPTRSRPAIWVTGLVLTAAALVVVVVGFVQVAVGTGSAFVDTLTTESRPTPVTAELDLDEGRYTVFELTGRTAGVGDDQVIEDRGTTITPALITVTGPDREPVEVRSSSFSETVTRNTAVYTNVATFTVDEPGFHTVQVEAPEPTEVIIGPALGSGFRDAVPWALATVGAGLVMVLGIALVILGVAWRRPVR